MNKYEFYEQLHKTLGDKYNLLPGQVATLRNFMHTKNRKEFAEWCAIKLSQLHPTSKSKKQKRSHNKTYYQQLLNFTASCSEKEWKDITLLTPYDKQSLSVN